MGGAGPFLVSVVAKDVTDKEIGSHIVDVDGPLAFELKLPESERKTPPPRR